MRPPGEAIDFADRAREIAAQGARTSASELPFLAEIQRSFGPEHPLRGVHAHTGPDARAAAHALRNDAFTTAEHVVFGRPPTLDTAAHEAAHVIQQRAGIMLPRGVGRPGDRHEELADRAAAHVVRGESAAPALASYRARTPSTSTAGDRVQGLDGVSEDFDRDYARRRKKYDGQDQAALGFSAPAKTFNDLRRFSAGIDDKDLKGKLRKMSTGDGALSGGDAAAIRARRTAQKSELGQTVADLGTKDLRIINKSVGKIFEKKDVPGFTPNDGASAPPRGSIVILSTKGAFLGAEVVVDSSINYDGYDNVLTVQTFSIYSMGTSLSKMKLKHRELDPANPMGVQALGWFALADLPDLPKKQQRVAYDFTSHDGTMPEAEYDEQVDRLLYIGQMAAGGNWHADGKDMFAAETEQVDTGRLTKKGAKIFETKETGNALRIANTQKADADRFGLARLIMDSDPSEQRWNLTTMKQASIFTTCIATSAFIVRTYLGEELNAVFTDYSGIGGIMSPIFDVKVGDRLMREGPGFQYLQDSGAYVPRDPTSDSRFELVKGDVYMTGTFENGAWTFQHYSLVGDVKPRPDGTVDLITIDGGQGDSRAGEDKTGFTQRVYDPATGILSGARPKEIIGVWKLPILKDALKNMSADLKAKLKPAPVSPGAPKYKPKPKK